MKTILKEAFNSWGPLVLVVTGMMWIVANKEDLPDEIEPVTVSEQDIALEPVQKAAQYVSKVTSEVSIKYHNQNMCDGVPTDLTELGDAYAMYLIAKGRAHHYQTMSRDDVCDDIASRRAARSR